MEALSFDNILGADEIDTLFEDSENMNTGKSSSKDTSEEVFDNTEDTDETDDATETDNTSLFDDDIQSESVGSGKNTEGAGDTSTDGGGASPNNFYSSIANAMAVDGIFPNLDDDVLKKVTDAESLSHAIDAEVEARLSEKQRRVSKALENGVNPDDIRNYENTLSFIAGIRDEDLEAEDDKGESLRYRLIFQDYLNKGYSKERADKYTKRSIDSGNDVEDAKEALLSNKEFFQKGYNTLLKKAQDAADKEKADQAKEAAYLKKSLLEDKGLLGDMDLSKDIRKKAYDAISKPAYKDPETGEYMTAVQKYESEHPADFLKYVGLLMTLTNNFKDFDSFIKGRVKKEMKKGMKDLEQVLTGTRRNSDGSLKLVSSVDDDPDSFIGKGFKLSL